MSMTEKLNIIFKNQDLAIHNFLESIKLIHRLNKIDNDKLKKLKMLRKLYNYQNVGQRDNVSDDEPLNTITNEPHYRRREENSPEREVQ